MKTLPHLLLTLLLILVPTVQAGAASHYVDPSEIDLTKILPAIAPLTDEQAKAEKDFELSAVIEQQQEASPADIQRARDEANTPGSNYRPSAFSFSDVIGPWFKADNAHLALTTALIQKIVDDAEGILKPAKKYWNRPRPFRQDPAEIKPLTDNPLEVPTASNTSYPSGHATEGILFALVLSDLAPQLRDKLIARGIEYGNDRVILGVHFPSDVAAGRVLGRAIYAVIKDKKAYQDDLTAAKTEFQKELLAHAGQ